MTKRSLDDARKFGRSLQPIHDLQAENGSADGASVFAILDANEIEADAQPKKITLAGVATAIAPLLLPSNSSNTQLLYNDSGVFGGDVDLTWNKTTNVMTVAGKVGIGTSSPSQIFHVAGDARIGANDASEVQLELGAGATGDRTVYVDLIGDTTYSDYGLRIIRNAGANAPSVLHHRGTDVLALVAKDAGAVTIATNNTERARIDSSGRLLVGTSANIAGGSVQIYGSNPFDAIRYAAASPGPTCQIGKSRSATVGVNAIVLSGDTLGNLVFSGDDGSSFVQAAAISAAVDGTPGANDMPGRLVFSTTPDGASVPEERMRISANGAVKVAGDNFQIATSKTPASATAAGTTGQIAWDASYIYVCTATNTWKRAALATW